MGDEKVIARTPAPVAYTAPRLPNGTRENGNDPWLVDVTCPSCGYGAHLMIPDPPHLGRSNPTAVGTSCPRSKCLSPLHLEMNPQGNYQAYFRVVWPQEIRVPDFNVPPDVLEDYREASSSFANGNWTAVLVMSRKTLERVLVDQGATATESLDAMIDFLRDDKQLISPKVAEAAKQIKGWGRLGHVAPEKGKRPQPDEAETAMKILDGILSAVYKFGQDLKESSDKRAARNR